MATTESRATRLTPPYGDTLVDLAVAPQPTDADIVLDGTKTSPDAAAEQILNLLFARGYFDTAD